MGALFALQCLVVEMGQALAALVVLEVVLVVELPLVALPVLVVPVVLLVVQLEVVQMAAAVVAESENMGESSPGRGCSWGC